jgi:hypothetical protein
MSDDKQLLNLWVVLKAIRSISDILRYLILRGFEKHETGIIQHEPSFLLLNRLWTEIMEQRSTAKLAFLTN